VFPSNPQHVPQMFPLAPHIYPTCFGQSWTFMYISCKGGTQREVPYCFYWEVPNVKDRPIKVAPSKR
jgi:hypothetical protein